MALCSNCDIDSVSGNKGIVVLIIKAFCADKFLGEVCVLKIKGQKLQGIETLTNTYNNITKLTWEKF